MVFLCGPERGSRLNDNVNMRKYETRAGSFRNALSPNLSPLPFLVSTVCTLHTVSFSQTIQSRRLAKSVRHYLYLKAMTPNEDASYQTPAPFLQAERLLSIQSHVVSGYVGTYHMFARFLESRLTLPFVPGGHRQSRWYLPPATSWIRRRCHQHGTTLQPRRYVQ